MRFRLLAFPIALLALSIDAGEPKAPLGPLVAPEPQESFSTTAMWESRYMLEGRDLLDGEGLSSATIEFESDGWLFGAWLAYSDGADYEERNFYTSYTIETGALEWYASYMFLQFPKDANANDNEAGFGVAAPEVLLGFTPALDW